MFRMDTIVRNIVEFEYQRTASKCPYLTRAEIEALVLGQLEAEGKAMRYFSRHSKAVAWKATPKMRKKVANYEIELVESEDDD